MAEVTNYIDKVSYNDTEQDIISRPLSADLAPEFSSSTAYSVGEYVMHGGQLYRFNSAHEAGAWTGNDVVAVAMGAEVSSLKDDLGERTGNLFCIAPGNLPELFTTGYKGVVVTKHRDGSFEINGTTSASLTILIGENITSPVPASTPWLPAGTYSFGLNHIGGQISSSSNTAFSVRAGTQQTIALALRNDMRVSTQTFDSTSMCYISVVEGITFTNFHVSIMINQGTTLLPYAPLITAYDYTARAGVDNNAENIANNTINIATNTENISTNTENITNIVANSVNTDRAITELKRYKSDTSYTSENLFKFSDYLQLPWTEKGVTVLCDVDGTVLINGQLESGLRLPLGTNMSGYVDTPWLPAGTYTFKMIVISGTVSSGGASAFSIRAGTTSNAVIYKNNPQSTQTFEDTVLCYLAFGSGTSFTNFKVRFIINNGTSPIEYAPNLITPDYVLRNKVLQGNEYVYPLLLGNKAYRSQGGCYNGSIFTWLLYSSGNGRVAKHSIDPITGAISGGVITPDMSILNHCQDLTYNPTENAFYVSTILSTGDIVKLNSEFEYVSTVQPVDADGNTYTSCGVAYDRKNNRYIVEDDETFGFNIYDSSWQYVSTINPDETTSPSLVKQGIETDGTYIYRAFTTTESSAPIITPIIRTYKMDGTYIDEYNIAQLDGQEIEGIAYDWDNGVFFINTNLKNVAQTNLYLITPNRFAYHATADTMWLVRRKLLRLA